MTEETKERETMSKLDLALLDTALGAIKQARAILDQIENRRQVEQDLRDKLMGA